MSLAPTRARPPGQLLRIGDVLAVLPVSEATLARLRARGDFPAPAQQIGRIPMWRRAQLDEFLKRRMGQPGEARPTNDRPARVSASKNFDGRFGFFDQIQRWIGRNDPHLS